MFIVYEYAACILVAMIATALPFTLFAILLLLKIGAGYLLRTLQTLSLRASYAIADNLSRRTLSRSLAPRRIAIVYSEERSK
jgi:hypothetical protein